MSAPSRLKRALLPACLVLGVVAALLAVGLVVPLQFLALMVGGWVPYLRRTVPQIEWNLEPIAIGVGCLVALAVFGHRSATWLHAGWRREPPDLARRPWRLRWSLSALAMFVLLFASAISSVGVVHQLAWLAREPTLTVGGGYHSKVKRTMSSLRTVGTAVESYQIDFGYVPPLGDGRVEALVPFLEPTYVRKLPVQDGWGRPLYWRHWPGADSYSVVSAGKDGIGEPNPEPGPTTSYDADIYFSGGSFTRYPNVQH